MNRLYLSVYKASLPPFQFQVIFNVTAFLNAFSSIYLPKLAGSDYTVSYLLSPHAVFFFIGFNMGSL